MGFIGLLGIGQGPLKKVGLTIINSLGRKPWGPYWGPFKEGWIGLGIGLRKGCAFFPPNFVVFLKGREGQLGHREELKRGGKFGTFKQLGHLVNSSWVNFGETGGKRPVLNLTIPWEEERPLKKGVGLGCWGNCEVWGLGPTLGRLSLL